VTSLSTRPSITTPSWPSDEYGSSATSVHTKSSGNAPFSARIARWHQALRIQTLATARILHVVAQRRKQLDGRHAQSERFARKLYGQVHAEPSLTRHRRDRGALLFALLEEERQNEVWRA